MGLIVVLGISTMAVGQYWKVVVQRDKEAELYFRGSRIKHAIERYAADFQVQKGTRLNKYPRALVQLVESPKRYLPSLYDDPLTGNPFDLIWIAGEIRGVKSHSTARPFNQMLFASASRYDQILFEAREPEAPKCADFRASPLTTCQVAVSILRNQ